MTSDITRIPSFYTVANYSCDAYGSGTYSSCVTAQEGSAGQQGGLVNTGYDILIPLSLAGALIIAGSLLLFKRWKRRRAVALNKD